MATIKSTGNEYLNTYAELKNSLKQGNYLYSDEDWAQNAKYGTLDAYIGMVSQLGKDKAIADKFLADYDAKYLPEKYRTLAMSNELYANKKDKKTYDYYDQQGVKQQGEFTEYEWTKRLLADKVAEQKELFAADELKKVQDSANIFYKGLVGGWSILRGVVGGTASAVGSIYNIFEGIYRGIAEGDEGFRAAFKDNELDFVGNALRDWSYDWERNAGAYDYYGNRTSLASFVDGLGESVGRMLPSVLVSQLGGARIPQGTTLDSAAKAAEAATKLSTASRAIFYASVASDNLADALNDASLSKLPTVALVARSTVQTALEVAVEDLLGKKFGRTAIDNLTYGLGSYAGRGVTVKSIIGNIGKDALQEGLEEVLQDYSHWFVDSFVSTAFKAFGNTEYANIFQNASQFNLNTAIDAFMAGAIMSMAGSMVQIIKSKRVDTGKPVVDKDGNIVYDKKGNIKTEKFGKFKSYLFNETAKSIIDNANAVLRDENISTRDRVVMMQALQSSMRTYSEMLGGLGEERLNKAVQMLSVLNESYNITEEIPDNILEQRAQYRKDTALAIEAFLRETRDEYRNVKITTKDADDMAEQNISEPVGLITATTEATDNATNTAKDVLKATGAEVVITTKDGTGPILSEDGKAIIVPEAQVTNLSSNQLVASIAETKLFRSISDDKRYAAAFGRILDIYKQLPKNKNVDTTTKAFKRKCAAELVTNSDFVALVLECNDKDVFDLVVTLQKEAPKTVSKLKNAIYRQRINEAIADCKEIIIDYLCTKSSVVDYTAYPFLSQDDIMSIRAERWSLDIGYKIATDANYKPTVNDKRVFEIKVDASGVSNGAELKELFATDPKKAIGQLADEYYYNYYSKYDNKYYMKIGTVPNALMNQYLKSTGLNVPKLEKDIAKYQKDFELFTNGFYSFEINNGVCEVVELKRQTYTVARTETQKDYNIVYSVSGETIPNLINNIVTKDLPEKAKSQLSLNDIITNPSLWSEEFKQSLDELSPEAAYQSIKNKLLVQSDGQLSVEQLSDGTYVMANLAPMNKIITDTANDTFVDLANKCVNILYTSEKGRGIIDTEATSTIRLDNMYLSQGIPVQDIFKDEYVPDALQDHVIVFRDKGRPNITGSYDRAAKRIIVNLGTLKYIVKNAEQLYESSTDISLNDIQDLYEIIALQIKETILHEYAHALQVANNLSSGFVDIFNVITDPAIQQQIINDIKRHMPGVVPAKKSIAKEVVTNLIYGNEAGEAGARGANNYRYTPFVSNVDEAGNMTLTTAWGSVYNLTEPRKSTFVRTKGDIAKAEYPVIATDTKEDVKQIIPESRILFNKTFRLMNNNFIISVDKARYASPDEVSNRISKASDYKADIYSNYDVMNYVGAPIGGKGLAKTIAKSIADTRVNFIKSVTPELKQKMLYTLYQQICGQYDITFDEFINMDVPFIRLSDNNEYIEGGVFSSVSMYNPDYTIPPILTKKNRDNAYIYIGKIKPKDLLAYIPHTFTEGIIPSGRLKDCIVVRLTDNGNVKLPADIIHKNVDNFVNSSNKTSLESMNSSTQGCFVFTKTSQDKTPNLYKISSDSSLLDYDYTYDNISYNLSLTDIDLYLNGTGGILIQKNSGNNVATCYNWNADTLNVATRLSKTFQRVYLCLSSSDRTYSTMVSIGQIVRSDDLSIAEKQNIIKQGYNNLLKNFTSNLMQINKNSLYSLQMFKDIIDEMSKHPDYDSIKNLEVLSKTSDKTFTDIQEKLKAKAEKRAIAKQERKTIAEKMASRAKITVNTQVRGYLRKYIGKRIDSGIFRLIEDVQVNQSSFDPVFVDLVKDGKITSKTAVADYLLRNDSNDTTLEYIIRDVFDSSISLKELKLSLYSAGDTYALQAIFKRLVNDGLITKKQMDDWLYNPHNINAFISTIVKLIKKSENSSEYIKLYKQITDKYNQTYDEQNQKLLRVYLIKNYDGTPNSLVKAAKYARIAALNPTDYDKKTRSIEETVSTSKNKNGSDDDITLEDTLADTRYDDTFEQFFSDDTVREMARAIYESRLTELAKKYNKLSKEQLRSITFKRSIALKAQELLESIVSMNDSQIRREYDTLQQESKLSELEVKELRNRSSLQQNVQQKAKRAIEAIRLPTGKISKTLYKKLVKKYPDVGFKPDADLSVKNPDVWSMPTKDGHALDRADVSDLIDTMSNVYKYAVALTKQRQKVAEQKQKISKLSEQLSEAGQKEKALQEEINQLRKEGKTVVKQEIDTETVYVDNSSPMPEKFKDLLDVVFSKLRETKGKFVQVGEMHTVKSYNEWLEATADTLSSLTTEDGNEILKYILSTNAITSKYGNDEDIKFDSVAMWTYSYLYSMRNKLNLDAELIQQVQEKFDHDKSRWGTLMSLSQRAMNELNPAATVFMAEARNYNIHFDKTDVVRLSDAIDDLKGTADKKSFNEKMAKIQQLYNDMYNKALSEYKGNKRKLLDRILSFQRAAMLSGPGTWIRNITSNIVLEASNNLSAKVGDLVWNKLGKFADIVAEKKRSKLKVPEYDTTIDEGLSIANKMLDEDVKQMNRDDLSDVEKRLTKKYFVALKEADDQAKDRTLSKKHTEDIDKGIAKLQAEYLELTKLPKDDVKVEQRKYTLEAKIKERLQLKEMYANPDKVAADVKKAIDAVTKYSKYLKDIEAYESKIKSDPIHKSLKGQYKIVGTKVDSETIAFIKEYIIDSGLLKMLQSGLSKYDVSNAPKGDTEQLVDMIEKSIRSEIFANNQFSNESLNKATALLFQKILTDNKYIDRAFIKYLGAIIVEDGIDITHGITREIQIAMTRAYTMACWDYMHGTNILYELETKIRSMLGDKAYFMYKQVFPFAGASMNWFIESLRYGPLGLGKAIKDFMSFEEYVAKMQSKAEAGQGPSEKFASYILKRNLGKGLFGTATWLLGAVLAMLGVIKVVEDKYGNSKLQIGNTNIAIDIHDVQATTGFTLGAIMASAFNDDTTILDVMKTTLDAMFMDSTIGDAINTLRYSTGVGDLLLDTAQSSVQMFIPNMLKVFNSSLYSHKIKYSSGLKGQLQRLGVQIIPGLAYAMPKYYDPYTGEQQVKYYPSFWGWAAGAVNKFSPVKISPLYMSEMEKTALSLGISKGSLKGEYSDTGAFTDTQVEQLNKKYGQLNKDELNKFRLGKSKYSVMMYDKNGNSLGYYKELTYQQMSNKQRKSVINRIMANNAKYAKIYVWTSAGHKYYTSKEERSELIKLGLYKNIFVKSKNKEGFIE